MNLAKGNKIRQGRDVVHEGTYNELMRIKDLGRKIGEGITREFHNQRSIFQLIIEH